MVADQKTEKAMAALDTMAAVWAAKTNARHAVRVMLACSDAEDRLMAYLQHGHAEGLFEGFHAGKNFRRPDGVPAAPALQQWEPAFDVMSPKQEELVKQFCAEIAGRRGERGSAPDPVRLLEMAQELYQAEREECGPAGVPEVYGSRGERSGAAMLERTRGVQATPGETPTPAHADGAASTPD